MTILDGQGTRPTKGVVTDEGQKDTETVWTPTLVTVISLLTVTWLLTVAVAVLTTVAVLRSVAVLMTSNVEIEPLMEVTT